MPYRTFNEYVARRDEGLLMPDKPAVPGMPRINLFPTTQARLKKTLTPVKQPPPQPAFMPVRKVKPIPTIPPHMGIAM